MTIPTIHLNGTAAQDLFAALEEAHIAILDAEAKLRATAPNGRDYYVQGPEALYKAQDEHYARCQKLAEVRGDLIALMEGIADQKAAR
jgi:hypothetical protein